MGVSLFYGVPGTLFSLPEWFSPKSSKLFVFPPKRSDPQSLPHGSQKPSLGDESHRKLPPIGGLEPGGLVVFRKGVPSTIYKSQGLNSESKPPGSKPPTKADLTQGNQKETADFDRRASLLRGMFLGDGSHPTKNQDMGVDQYS